MAAQVGREHAAVRPALLREPLEALAVARDAVQADERRAGWVAQFVDVQLHGRDDTQRMELCVHEGDIAAVEADAVANAANDHFWMGAGVAGALKRAGGEEIEREAMALGPILRGSAVATGAGRLPVRYVIHGAVMGQDLTTDARLVRRRPAPVSGSRTSSGAGRPRCPRSAPVSAGSRSTSAPGSWSPRPGPSAAPRSDA